LLLAVLTTVCASLTSLLTTTFLRAGRDCRPSTLLDIPVTALGALAKRLEAAANAAFIDSFRTMMLTASGIAVLSALAAAAIFDSQPKRVMSDSQRKLDGTAGGPPAEAQNKTDSTPENAVAETKPVITREEITMTCGDPS
jgi:hypothetical protein